MIAAVAAALVLSGAALADPQNDRARVGRDLAQAQATLESATERAQQAVAAYTAATQALPAAQQAAADAKGRADAAGVAARQADREAAAAEEVKRGAARAYDAASTKVDEARDDASHLAAAAYEGSGVLALNAVLTATSPSDLADRLSYLNQLAQRNQRALDGVSAARLVAKEHENVAETARLRAEQARAAAAQALAESQSAVAATAQAQQTVEDLIANGKEAMSVADAERGAVLARYDQVKQESDRIAAQLRGLASTGGNNGRAAPPPASGGAYFPLPTAGYKSSDFGERYDPYYHVWQLHAGVDIAAPGGQSIYAPADGKIVYAGWNGGYGNYTCISHGQYQGQNLSTCYGHQSSIGVTVGQWVHRGDVIGRVGTTGASTGYHLHFEVRLDGTPVNPLPWLPSCFC
jgi:murein DD-endopeptidase MepM/ murein hydrolase activator NlpD